MKLASITSFLALFAATQACALKACTARDGGGNCSPFKDQEDGGCHSVGDANVIKSWVWTGNDCSGSSKKLCGWQTGACNGQKRHIANVNLRPQNNVQNVGQFEFDVRSWKFMNSNNC